MTVFSANFIYQNMKKLIPIIFMAMLSLMAKAEFMTVTLTNGDTIYYRTDDIFEITFSQDTLRNDTTLSVFSEDTTANKFLEFVFLSSKNPQKVYKDVYAKIDGDTITLVTPYIQNLSRLVPTFSTTGQVVMANGVEQKSGVSSVDFSSPVIYTVGDQDGHSKEYVVNIQMTGLPLLVINTEGNAAITSKKDYLPAVFSIYDNISEDSEINKLGLCLGKIRGRGNSTWGMAKRPYKIKFESKQPLFGEPADKEWVLLANYSDKTMIRNAISFWIGNEISNLDYTSSFHFVELELNGKYVGTYLVAEQIKISKHRVNVGDDGFILEVDAKADPSDPTFDGQYASSINIKDPDVEVGDTNFNFIKDYVLKAEQALYSISDTDSVPEYHKYFDLESFVDWYLVNEISRNCDAAFYTSCYMYKTRTGKLHMGPLWDFDIAYGNIDYNNHWLVEGWRMKSSRWIVKMFQDPVFVSMVKERMAFYYSRKDAILDKISEMANDLKYAQKANDDVWHTMNKYVWPNYKVWGSYDAEVEYLKDWLSQRMDWLNTNIQDL